MAITKDDVVYISKLSRISMSEKEIASFTSQLDSILEYMKKLNELDTDNIKPTSHVLDVNNVVRKDEVVENSDREEILSNAPDLDNNFFRVPKIIE